MRLKDYDTRDNWEDWMDELGVSENHHVREVCEKAVDAGYSSQRVSAAPSSIEAAAVYLATQTHSEYRQISQREISDITGVSRGSIRKHYQEIARAIGREMGII